MNMSPLCFRLFSHFHAFRCGVLVNYLTVRMKKTTSTFIFWFLESRMKWWVVHFTASSRRVKSLSFHKDTWMAWKKKPFLQSEQQNSISGTVKKRRKIYYKLSFSAWFPEEKDEVQQNSDYLAFRMWMCTFRLQLDRRSNTLAREREREREKCRNFVTCWVHTWLELLNKSICASRHRNNSAFSGLKA